MGKLLEFNPKPDLLDASEAYEALLEADSLVEFAAGAFPEDSVDFVALERCRMVLTAVIHGLETDRMLKDLGIDPPDRTYHGDEVEGDGVPGDDGEE